MRDGFGFLKAKKIFVSNKMKSVIYRINNTLDRKIVNFEGSTRAIALIRIGLVFLIWTRYASEMLPFQRLSPVPFQIFTGISLFISTLLMLFGFFTRISTGWTAANLIWIYYYAGIVIKGGNGFQFHYTYSLMAFTVLISLTPCGKSLSIDRYLELKKADKNNLPIPTENGKLWATRLIGLQISSMYFWSGIDKCYWGYLSGARMEHYFVYFYTSSNYPDFQFFSEIMLILSIATVVIEFVLCFLLWFEKFQKFIIPMAILFHLIIYYTLSVKIYSLTMCLMFLIFINPDKVHNFIDKLLGHKPLKSQ